MIENRIYRDFQEEVGVWAEDTFPKSTNQAKVKHLKKEVVELEESNSPEEAADCFLILLHHAHKNGYDLLLEARKKHEINKNRKWNKPDKDGVVEHKRGINEMQKL